MDRTLLPESWRNDRDLSCIILAAGRGLRAEPLTDGLPKTLVPFRGRPLLDHTLERWAPLVRRFLVVVHHRKELLLDHLARRPEPVAVVAQPRLGGIAHALQCCRPFTGKRFIVILGDCYCEGAFRFPPAMDQGVAVQEDQGPERIRQSYSVVTDTAGRVRQVCEKPRTPPNRLLGMGYYFLDDMVFGFIEKTPPSLLRNEVEITDVIGAMIAADLPVHAIPFHGDYLNLNRADDLNAGAKPKDAAPA